VRVITTVQAMSARFHANERVLAFHGPLIYEAKVLKVAQIKDKNQKSEMTAGAGEGQDGKTKDSKDQPKSVSGNYKFFIHYHGWNKNWDEWVAEPRILKYTESNLERKKELIKAHEANVKAKKAVSTSNNSATKRKAGEPSSDTSVPSPSPSNSSEATPGSSKSAKVDPGMNPVVSLGEKLPDVCPSPPPPPEGKSRKGKVEVSVSASASSGNAGNDSAPLVDKPPQDNTVETEDQFNTKVEIRIRVPDELKPYLVDDWDYLSRQRKLVMLPAQQTVDTIIQDYIKYKSGSGKRTSTSGRESAVQEVTSGLREYFNVMLGSQLLYKFEREQHSDIIKQFPDRPMCKIYGAIHFLRLFVKLGAMLTYTPLDEKSVQLLLYYINDFLSYMKKNASTLFTIADYGTASPEYHRRAL